MLPEAKSEDLLYVSGGCGGACVLSYPSGKLVGTVSVAFTLGSCADGKGDIFLTNDKDLEEYAHGGTSPIATFSLPGQTYSCGIDPQTGNLAVTYLITNGNDVAVFPSGLGPPILYNVDLVGVYCGYDPQGNLYVSGTGKYDATYLSELPKNGNSFSDISITPYPNGAQPGQVQWDGKYLTMELLGQNEGQGVSVDRLSVSGSVAEVIGKTKFKGVTRSAGQSWIQNGEIFIPYGTRGDRVYPAKLGTWKYPRGGILEQKYQHFAGQHPGLTAVTYSAATR